MIYKNYELKKLDLNLNNFLLIYGKNEGLKEDIISEIKLRKYNKILKYEEKDVLKNPEFIYSEILTESLFEEKKIIIIKQNTDKILTIIENLQHKKIKDILIIIDANILEKKSKLRIFFEKEKKFICIPVYEDTHETLTKLTLNFLKEKNISISQENINLIVSRTNGDRSVLKNELIKIYFFTKNGKKITSENLLKLTNLIDNHSISELVDNCLAKNRKKTISILNENNFSAEDCIVIIRIFLNKLKRILGLLKEYEKNKNLNNVISFAKPPIFWKDKEIIKQQIMNWKSNNIKKLIYEISETERQIKINHINPINIVLNFILTKSS